MDARIRSRAASRTTNQVQQLTLPSHVSAAAPNSRRRVLTSKGLPTATIVRLYFDCETTPATYAVN
ncbi:MAG: hypothetical protein V4801_15895 [Burkholderia gladioli]